MGKRVQCKTPVDMVKNDGKKKPAAAKKRPRQYISPEDFRADFLPICKTSTSLPYPKDGGRRGDLAIGCWPWIKAATSKSALAMNKSTMISGFHAIHACRKEELSEDVWGVTDAQATSWATQMTARLKNLCRHYEQASKSKPQWYNMITVKIEKSEEAPATTSTRAAATTTTQQQQSDAEDVESEEAVVASPVSASLPDGFEKAVAADLGVGSSDGEDDDAEEGNEEEEEEDDDDDGARTKWNVHWSHECSRAYRVEEGGHKKDYTSVYHKPTKTSDELSPVVGIWPDGYEGEVPGICLGTVFPDFFKVGGLPASGKQKKTRGEKEPLWRGPNQSARMGLGSLTIGWRHSRGWNMTLYNNGKQVSQIKPECYTTEDSKDVTDTCLKLMIQVAEDFAIDKVKVGELIKHRDSILHKFALVPWKGKPAEKKSSPSSAAPAANTATTTTATTSAPATLAAVAPKAQPPIGSEKKKREKWRLRNRATAQRHRRQPHRLLR